MSIIRYSADLSNYVFDEDILPEVQIEDRHRIMNAINSIADYIEGSLDPIVSSQLDYVKSVDLSKITTTVLNELSIGSDACVLWNASSQSEVSGWGAKTFSELENETTYVVWMTYVSGIKDYEISKLGVLPSAIDSKYPIGWVNVDVSGSVIFGEGKASQIDALPHIFKKPVFALDGMSVNSLSINELNYQGNPIELNTTIPPNYMDVRVNYLNGGAIKISGGSVAQHNNGDIYFGDDLIINLTI